MLRHRNNKAQSTAEYVIVLGLIVAAVVAMQSYIKRGFQGRIKDAVDYKGEGGVNGVVSFTTNQYEPYYLSSTFDSVRSSNETEDLFEKGSVNRTTEEFSNREGNQIIGVVKQSN